MMRHGDTMKYNPSRFFLNDAHYYSNVFQLPEGRMLSYFGIVPEGSILDVPNAALGMYRSFCLMHKI